MIATAPRAATTPDHAAAIALGAGLALSRHAASSVDLT